MMLIAALCCRAQDQERKLLDRLLKISPETFVLLITAYSTVENALRVLLAIRPQRYSGRRAAASVVLPQSPRGRRRVFSNR